MWIACWLAFLALAVPFPSVARPTDVDYRADVRYLLDEFERQAGPLLSAKKIDWQAVRKEFEAAAHDVKDDVAHVQLCRRLIARLKDGHAGFTSMKAKLPEAAPEYGVGLCFAEAKGVILVKQSFGPALASGVEAGFALVSVDGVKAPDWLEAKARALVDTSGFSTAHAARYAACHWGLAGPEGTKFELVFDRGEKARKSVSLVCAKAGGAPRYVGSPFPPQGLESLGRRDAYGKLDGGWGYIQLGECAEGLPGELDLALGSLGDVPGLILDLRANNGGGTDHDEVFGRFLGPDQRFAQYTGRGRAHYTGPLVVIVDEGTRSTGETISGMFKEDGRGYLIGPGPTAGMSAQKKEITVPSGLFSVRFAVHSNKARFNGGAGIEGLGVPPHELVPWDRALLEGGVDPCLRRAAELLSKGFPKGVVKYAPPKSKSR